MESQTSKLKSKLRELLSQKEGISTQCLFLVTIWLKSLLNKSRKKSMTGTRKSLSAILISKLILEKNKR